MINNILYIYITVSALLFALGLYAVLVRKHAIIILLGIELMLNASMLNLVAFSKLYANAAIAQTVSLFIIVLAVAAACVALAILVNAYKYVKNINPDTFTELKD